MLEHPPQLNIAQSELAPRVADYFDNLLAQRDAILASYDLTPETADEFCNLRSTDEDREKILALYENMVYVIENKQIPASEVLEQERKKEQQRIDDFFGKDAHIEVPPLPPTITPERIKQWKQKRFELRYLPSLTLEEGNDYPGWIEKPTHNINFFDKLDQIQNLSENQQNPHLENLAPNQLIGCWMLVDTRPKPDFQNYSIQIYEDDEDMQAIIKQLAENNIVNQEARDGRRNYIRHSTFNNPKFWQQFYDYLGINADEDHAIVRLPRLIEQSMFGQGEEWRSTNTYEWAEEYYKAGQRLIFGFAVGGVSSVDRGVNGDGLIGFRCVVVFSSP